MADDPATKPIEQAKLIEHKVGERSDDSTAKLAGPSKIIKTADQDSSGYATTKCESKELEGVLLHTRRLTVCDELSHTHIRHGREGEKSGLTTEMTGDARRKLYVIEWKSTDDETHLVIMDHVHYLGDVISILAPLCPAVEHFSFDFHVIRSLQSIHIPTPMPMRSVITVCIKSRMCYETLHEALLAVSNFFPNAESVDVQIDMLRFPSEQAYFHEVNSSSSLRELKLRCESRLMDISTSCPNIVSLVLLGFGRCLSNKSGKDIASCKMLHLTNIQFEPFGRDDCYRFETFMYVLHVYHVISPRLRFVEAKKVQLGGAELTCVKWSQTSSGCELQLEGASAAVPIADLMHLVSNELKGVTVLTLDRCKVDFPQSVSHPLQKENLVRELKFLNLESPLSQTDTHKLSEMYPDVKVTVEHEGQASHGDSEQGTVKKTSPSSPPSPTSSIDELVGATSRVQVHEEQTDTQNTEEEGKEEEEEDHMAMESLPHETDEVNVKPIKMECCKRVGVEGDKLQLDSFGIELEIPPGAIDCEAPQEISLCVLTDTSNLGNSKEEMSVCFGVQCLAPDDLVLQLPVTYTIPHCAVIARYSSVEAVLYTGEGEYSPDAEVKEQIPLTRSGIPNCNIERDTLRLQMNHFSWAFIKFKLTVFFGGKRMRCLPFAEKPLPEEKNPVVLRAHLYDDIKGIYMKIVSQEEGIGLACIHPEAEVLIRVAEVDVRMTCFIKDDPIGGTVHTVKYDELQIGHQWTKSFNLDLSSQPDNKIIVILQVGQTGQSLVDLHCIFNFAMNRSGKQDDFEKRLTTVARKVATRVDIDNLGKALDLQPGDIQHYVNDNKDSSYMVTLSMLRDWRQKQPKGKVCEALKDVLQEAGQIYLADELFGSS